MAKKTILISAIVIVIVISIFAAFFLTRDTKDVNNSNSLNSDNSANGIISQTEQASAGSYKSEKYGVEFDYPASWTISEREVQGDLSVKLFPNSKSNKGSLTISTDVKPFAFCSECNSLGEVESDITNSLEGSVQNLNSEEITLNGNDAVEITYTTSYGYASKSIYFMENNKIYTLAYLEESGVTETYQDGYNQIINSFSIN